MKTIPAEIEGMMIFTPDEMQAAVSRQMATERYEMKYRVRNAFLKGLIVGGIVTMALVALAWRMQ